MRNEENTNYHLVPFLPGAEQKMQKKKQKKLKKIIMASFKPKQFGKGQEKEKIKIIVMFRSNPTRNRKFQKNSKKIKKYHYGLISSHNRVEKDEKERR